MAFDLNSEDGKKVVVAMMMLETAFSDGGKTKFYDPVDLAAFAHSYIQSATFGTPVSEEAEKALSVLTGEQFGFFEIPPMPVSDEKA